VRYLAPMALVALAFGLHDVAVANGIPIPPSVVLIPYIGSIIALWGGARTVELLSTALAESEELNRDLERRVDERGAEIARKYDQIRELERARLLQSERERMMRDIHDGMGGQLTSMLSLVESDGVSRDEMADALRDALDDMRLLIASLGPTADDLLTLLATWRARIERRLERRGLVFDWQVVDLPPLPWLGPREALNVLRIFQEGITNIVKHANATTITVRTGMRPGADGAPGVMVEISDDGQGLATAAGDSEHGGAAPDATSLGLGNMARRAAELGGTIEIHAAHPGTRVELWLPYSRASRETSQEK
jgi:signal transduction histidine kinase